MKHNFKSMFGSKNTDVLFDVMAEESFSVVQDPIHIATKSRNRMLRCSVAMPMGNKPVSVSHLKILIASTSKDVHGLVKSDIIPEDRQNYRSFEKITENRVLEALRSKVIDSEGTIQYLKISKQVVSAFTEVNIHPLERIYRIWYSLYFLRAWRNWIISMAKDELNGLDAETNFVSTNFFTCVEINAYGLLHLITMFRDLDRPEYFLPTLFQSQACEQTFRQLRSMTTMSWTKINFSLLEMIQQIGRIDLQNQIIFSELSNTDIIFPRIQNKSTKFTVYPLPSNQQITEKLQEAQCNALQDAAKFGIHLKIDDIIRCELKKGTIKKKKAEFENPNGIPDRMHEDNDVSNQLPSHLHCSNLRNYYCDSSTELDNRFVQMVDENGSTKTVLKSSLIWILSETKGVLSNDRLKRVQCHGNNSEKNPKKRKKGIDNNFEEKRKKNNEHPTIYEELEIGDWCFFEYGECIVFGSVIGFRYAMAKTLKEKTYTLNYAKVKSNEDNLKEIEVLASWYRYDRKAELEIFKENPTFFISISNYIATWYAPDARLSSILSPVTIYELKDFKQVEETLKNLLNNSSNKRHLIQE